MNSNPIPQVHSSFHHPFSVRVVNLAPSNLSLLLLGSSPACHMMLSLPPIQYQKKTVLTKGPVRGSLERQKQFRYVGNMDVPGQDPHLILIAPTMYL